MSRYPIPEFNTGDIVRLVSGGPPMTVTMKRVDRPIVQTIWFSGEHFHVQVFPAACLVSWEAA